MGIPMKVLSEGHWIRPIFDTNGFKPMGLLFLLVFDQSSSFMEHRTSPLVNVSTQRYCTWHATIQQDAKRRRVEEALAQFQQNLQEGTKADKLTFVSILKACVDISALETGKQIHVHMLEVGIKRDVFLGNTLIVMYERCGSVDDARRVFNEMPQRNTVSWTAMITGYVRYRDAEEALTLYWQMLLAKTKPNELTLVCVINACASVGSLKHGKHIHADIISSGFESNVILACSLINMYAKHGSLTNARQLFDRLPDRNMVTWTAMISGYSQHGPAEEAVNLYWKMRQEDAEPDEITFVSTLKACASLGDLELGKQIHSIITTVGLGLSVLLCNTLVNMYAKCGTLETALKVFHGMVKRDVVSWTVMIEGCYENGLAIDALELFHQMQRDMIRPNKLTFISILKACGNLHFLEEGRQIHDRIVKSGVTLDVFVGSALVDMYSTCDCLDDAHQVFSKLLKKDVVSWTAMIAGYAQQGHGEQSLELFQKMLWDGEKANEVTFAIVLDICGCLADLEQGRNIHSYIYTCGLGGNISVGVALIDMYAKCGRLDDAQQVLDKMPERNLVTWTSMVAGYAQHGHGREALKLVDQMQQEDMKLDDVSFVGILSACSNAGLVDEGSLFFQCMSQSYGLTPKAQHYACMVDIFGRSGQLDAADDFIRRIPFQPNVIVWRALLGACRNHGNMKLAKYAAECVIELEPQDVASLVLLSNVLSTVGTWDD